MAAKRPLVGVAVAATVVSIGFLTLRGSGPVHRVETRAGGPSPAAPPATGPGAVDPTLVSTGRPSPTAPRPADIAAVVGGSVVLLDAADGHTVRTLATHAEAATGGFPYLEGVSLSPDRTAVFYSLAGDCGPAKIYRVAADGRTPPEAVVDGVSPAVSPDGRKLAYAVAAPGPSAVPGASAATGPPAGAADGPEGATKERHCQNAVVVRDLKTGAERTWRYPDTPDYGTALYRGAVISEIAWAPDSTRLAYTLSYEGDSVAILDTEKDTDLSQTEEVVVPDGGGDSSHPAWQASTGLLALFNTRFECCFDDNYTGPPRALLLDPDRRTESALLPAGRRVSALDFDASGAHLLFVEGGRLYRRDGPQAPVELAAGVTHADW
jgi:Tol biopolymer transport system component